MFQRRSQGTSCLETSKQTKHYDTPSDGDSTHCPAWHPVFVALATAGLRLVERSPAAPGDPLCYPAPSSRVALYLASCASGPAVATQAGRRDPFAASGEVAMAL